MAIQFPCPTCKQGIEVDDDLAGRQVTCFHCRSVVTAPLPAGAKPWSTDAGPTGGPPGKPPLPPSPGAQWAPPPGWTPPPGWGPPPWQAPTPKGNGVGVAAFVLSLASWGLLAMAVFCMVLLTQAAAKQGIALEDLVKKLAEQAATQPQPQLAAELAVPYGMAALSSCCSATLTLVALSLAIAGVARAGRPKGLSITALVLSGLQLLLFVMGMLAMAAGR